MRTRLDADIMASQLRSAGLALPDQAEAALATLEALAGHGQADPIAEAQADPKPLTSANAAKRVRDLALALTAQSRLSEAAAALEAPAVAEFFDAIYSNAERLIVQMKPNFALAAAVVQRAGELLPPAATREDAWAAGGEAHDLFHQLTSAIAVLDACKVVRNSIGMHAGPQPEMDVSNYIEGAEGREALVRAHMAWSHTNYNWHRLTAQGFILRLNTPEEAHRVEHDVERYDAKAAQRREDARREARGGDPLRDRVFRTVMGEEYQPT